MRDLPDSKEMNYPKDSKAPIEVTESKGPKDRLYDLLPIVHQMRDRDAGNPLYALLQIIGEQVNLVEDDIRQLYDNWFIETCQEWSVPYIGELIGYTPVHDSGESAGASVTQEQARAKIVVPRREVANTIRYRRRKGALALLELLSQDVAGWPARVVEFYTLLNWMQNLNHQRLLRGRTVDLRDGNALDLMEGAFSTTAHSVDVRRVNSTKSVGRYNIPELGLFVWRLRPYGVTTTQAYCDEKAGTNCYTFSVLGNNAQIYIKPQREQLPTDLAGELNVPAPMRRRVLQDDLKATAASSKDGTFDVSTLYGVEKSFAIWAPNWPQKGAPQPLPASMIVAADLSQWKYKPKNRQVAVDPVLGRIAFPKRCPHHGVQVTYHYAFSADIGGGEYPRSMLNPAGDDVVYYRVTAEDALGDFKTITQALDRWKTDAPQKAVIEIADSQVCGEAICIDFDNEYQTLIVRAASNTRPIVRLLDANVDRDDSLSILFRRGCRLMLDGLLLTGRCVRVENVHHDGVGDGSKFQGADNYQTFLPWLPATPSGCDDRPSLHIRHCTLVPGWTIQNDCQPDHYAEASLELCNLGGRVLIENSILGTIHVQQDQVTTEPLSIHIRNSILDATEADGTGAESEALCASDSGFAHVILTIQNSTVIGRVKVHAIEFGENTIFYGTIHVARSQRGCLRFCYLRPGCRVPRRYNCQPDLVERAVDEAFKKAEAKAAAEGQPPLTDEESRQKQAEIDQKKEAERARVMPRFNAIRYGKPAYCQLTNDCADEIKQGAADEAEMGAFHDLYQPQRLANLRARLEEFTPASFDAGIIFAS